MSDMDVATLNVCIFMTTNIPEQCSFVIASYMYQNFFSKHDCVFGHGSGGKSESSNPHLTTGTTTTTNNIKVISASCTEHTD